MSNVAHEVDRDKGKHVPKAFLNTGRLFGVQRWREHGNLAVVAVVRVARLNSHERSTHRLRVIPNTLRIDFNEVPKNYEE